MIGQDQGSKSTGADGSGNNDDRTTRSERDGSENHYIPVVVLLEIFCCIYIFIISLMIGGIMVFKCKAVFSFKCKTMPFAMFCFF